MDMQIVHFWLIRFLLILTAFLYILGAWILLDGKETKVYGSKLWSGDLPSGSEVKLEEGLTGLVHSDGLLLPGTDGKFVNVKLLNIEGKFVQVEQFWTKV